MKERRHGLSGRWSYLGHRVNRVKGMAFHVNYSCIETKSEFTHWSEFERYKDVYLVHYRNDDIVLKKRQNYAACMKSMRKTQAEESEALFCARMSQQYTPARH